MSVAKYIENYNQKRSKRIQKNIDYAKENPYPIDELNLLDEGSSIRKVFDENGMNNSHQTNDKLIAISDNRDLYNRLKNGSYGLRRLKQNEDLLKIDPNSELESRYSALIKGIGKYNLKLNEVLDGDNFEETYDYIMSGADIRGIDADVQFVITAFKEMSTDEEEEEINTINPDDIIDEAIDAEDPLNDEVGEITETDAISEVTETPPVLEREITPIDTEIEVENPINDSDAEYESGVANAMLSAKLDKGIELNDLNLIDVPSINPEVEKLLLEGDFEGASKLASNISNTTNEYNNVENQNSETINGGAESIINSEINQSSEVTESTSPSAAINSTGEGSSSTSGGSGYFDDDMAPTTAEDLALLRSSLGMSDVDESNSIINELTESTTINSSSPTLNSESNDIIDEVLEDTEVMKEKIGIDKKIAPINTPETTAIEDQYASKKDDVTLTEVKTEPAVAETKSTDTPSNVTNNENNNSENNSAGYTMTDMSGVEARLRKIEMLLSSPLEVKIVE